MPKKDIGFRFSEEVHTRLLELAEESGKTRTQVLEGLILGAPWHPKAKRVAVPVPPEEVEAAMKAKTEEKAIVKTALRRKTSVVDPDKLAAFQRKMNKK